MNKFKLSFALLAAYAAGELVTTAMQIYKLDVALKNGTFYTKASLVKAQSDFYMLGADDALSNAKLVTEAYGNLHRPSIHSYLN